MNLTLDFVENSEPQLIGLSAEGAISQHTHLDGVDPFQSAVGDHAYELRVIFNLTNVNFIDSSGIGWLINSHKQFQQAGGRLVLHSAPEHVQRTFRLLCLGNAIETASDEAEARTTIAATRENAEHE